jgi:NAD(P)-dependent dehydrogenase (short-subunit alcohol dehydrogenase family)
MDLTGKAALVTGGASGIGAAAVRRLAAAGAVVAIADRDEAGARALAAEVGGLALPGDVSDPALLKMSLDIAEDAFGRLTTVLLNAGITAGQSGVENLDIAGYRRIMAVNVDHVVFGLTAAVPALRRAGGGHIVVTASLAGLVPMPGDALYTLTKHAVVGYVRAAAPTLAAEGIRVNAVCPGFADTPLLAAARDQFGDFPLLSAEDVADAVEAVLERGEPGECWFCQPGREPAPYGFRGAPGPAGGVAPPPVSWADH